MQLSHHTNAWVVFFSIGKYVFFLSLYPWILKYQIYLYFPERIIELFSTNVSIIGWYIDLGFYFEWCNRRLRRSHAINGGLMPLTFGVLLVRILFFIPGGYNSSSFLAIVFMRQVIISLGSQHNNTSLQQGNLTSGSSWHCLTWGDPSFFAVRVFQLFLKWFYALFIPTPGFTIQDLFPSNFERGLDTNLI